MATIYHIKVRSKSGVIKTGYLPATDHGDLLAKLQAHGWRLIEILPDEPASIPRLPLDDGIEIGHLKGWLVGGSAFLLLVVLFAIAGNAPPPSQKADATAISAAQRAKLDTYQAVTTRVAQWRNDGVQVSSNHATVAEVDAEAFRLRDYERVTSARATSYSPIAENGDRRGIDNDGDGRSEPVHVKGYTKANGTYVQEQYRALPQTSSGGSSSYTAPRSSPSASGGGTVHVNGYYKSNGTYVAPHTRSAPRR